MEQKEIEKKEVEKEPKNYPSENVDERLTDSLEILLNRVVAREDFVAEVVKLPFMTAPLADRINSESKSFGPNIFVFSIASKTRSWLIKKRIKDFVDLDHDIMSRIKKAKITVDGSIPRVPAIKNCSPEAIGTKFAAYLQELAAKTIIRENFEKFWEFIEYGRVNLDESIKKFKEGYVYKRAGGRYKESMVRAYCGALCRRWKVRWLVVCQEGIIYTIDSTQSKIREILLFDNTFTYVFGREHTGTKFGLTLMTSRRQLAVKTNDLFDYLDWIVAIEEAKLSSPYTRINRYLSFAPVRECNSLCKFYIDGNDYFSDICDAINTAQKEVFITSWWVSPELYLKRPVSETMNQDSRLDRVLQKVASRGVKVYVIVYKEFTYSLYNDSKYTKKALEELHENIEVMLHPANMVFLWSHHEKTVTIDQSIGFTGGLDLCYGRYDTSDHPLSDECWLKDQNCEKYPDIDYYNVRVKDFENVSEFKRDLYDRASVHRMPWHDVAMMVVGDAAKDIGRHFIQYWNFVKSDRAPKKEQYFLTPVENPKFREDGTLLLKKPTFSDRFRNIIHSKVFHDFKRKQETKESDKKADDVALKNSKEGISKQVPKESARSNVLELDPKRQEFIEEMMRKKTSFGQKMSKSSMPELESIMEEKIKDKKKNELRDKKDEVKEVNMVESYGRNPCEEVEKIGREGDHNIKHTKSSDVDDMSGFFEENASRNDVYDFNENQPRKKDFPIEEEKERKADSPQIYLEEVDVPKDLREEKDIVTSKAERKYPRERSQTVAMNLETAMPTQETLEQLPPIQRRGESKHLNTEIPRAQPLDSKFYDIVKKALQVSHNPDANYEYKENSKKPEDKIEKNKRKFLAGWRQELDSTARKPSETQTMSKSQSLRNSQSLSKPQSKSPQRGMQISRLSQIPTWRNKKRFGSGTEILTPDLKPRTKSKGAYTCQVLRSVSKWSMGLKENTKEASIQIAYLELIRKAQHFIYIENQFFISQSAGDEVYNQISEALILRIKEAAINGEKFRVVVFLPLIHAFAGEFEDSTGAVIRLQLNWQYQTICRGGTSIIETLRADPNIKDPFEYISFFALRKHELFKGEPRTELIYIHSKLMIVDDQIVILGSANINDRSMLGTRDSELCVVVEDQDTVASKMNGEDWLAKKFAHNFRVNLMKEHLGIEEQYLQDPTSDEAWERLLKISKRNTEIYRQVFAVCPDDTVKKFDEIEKFKNKKNLSLYESLSQEISGQIVDFPLQFLENENLKLNVFNKEFFAPDISFT